MPDLLRSSHSDNANANAEAFGGPGSFNSSPTEVVMEYTALVERARNAEELVRQQAVLLSMLAEVIDADSLEQSLDSLALGLQSRFNCDRVAIALMSDDELVLKSVSQQAVLDASSSEARLLVDAMQEACDRGAIVSWPPVDDSLGVLVAHRTLAGRRHAAVTCSAPMYADEKLIGAFLLEKRKGEQFPITLLERLSMSIAPMLKLRMDGDRGIPAILGQRLKSILKKYLGADRPALRALIMLIALALTSSFFIPMQWQVVASAELLPRERRLVTSPQAGFVETSFVTAGDTVEAGQLLATLDRRDIELEAVSRDGDVAVAEAEFRSAMASYDRQAIGITRARLAQERAKRELVENRLDRLELHSPIDGIVIAADASRASGAVVSRGETLFEIAPNENFEVHILVDEADVLDVRNGQAGELVLRASPGEKIPFTVDTIHPVAETEAGASRFRVRASLTGEVTSLRPGQSGVARLDAGSLSAFGVLTRRFNRRMDELWWRLVG